MSRVTGIHKYTLNESLKKLGKLINEILMWIFFPKNFF